VKLTRISALLVAAVLPLAACDSGTDPDDLDFGEFRGDVSGEFSADLNGRANSGITQGFTGGQDQILLSDAGEGVQIAVFHQDAEFVLGTSPVGPDDEVGVTAAIFFEDAGRAFLATSGTMVIDEITTGGILGSIAFSAVEFDINTGQTLSDRVSVDVVFNTDFSTSCCFNRAPFSGTVRLHKTPVN
jgi:hypothetical protein